MCLQTLKTAEHAFTGRPVHASFLVSSLARNTI